MAFIRIYHSGIIHLGDFFVDWVVCKGVGNVLDRCGFYLERLLVAVVALWMLDVGGLGLDWDGMVVGVE